MLLKIHFAISIATLLTMAFGIIFVAYDVKEKLKCEHVDIHKIKNKGDFEFVMSLLAITALCFVPIVNIIMVVALIFGEMYLVELVTEDIKEDIDE